MKDLNYLISAINEYFEFAMKKILMTNQSRCVLTKFKTRKKIKITTEYPLHPATNARNTNNLLESNQPNITKVKNGERREYSEARNCESALINDI